MHDRGRDGLREAKRWLDMSTRVQRSWTHSDRGMSELLVFKWPHASTSFSFDLGGTFRGEDLDNQSFVAEVKNYASESDLPQHYRDFLAKCYVAYRAHPDRCDHFLWLSWSPFQAQKWHVHTSIETVKAAILHKDNTGRVLGAKEPSEAEALLDTAALAAVSERIWLLTLAKRQVQLVPTREHYAEVIKMITMKAVM